MIWKKSGLLISICKKVIPFIVTDKKYKLNNTKYTSTG